MFERLRSFVAEDFDAFSGHALERYFEWKFAEEERYTTIGGWWDRKGENEIDLVCEDDLAGKIDFFEVKRDKGRYRSDLLARKVEAFLEKNPHKRKFTRSVGLLSLEDM